MTSAGGLGMLAEPRPPKLPGRIRFDVGGRFRAFPHPYNEKRPSFWPGQFDSQGRRAEARGLDIRGFVCVRRFWRAEGVNRLRGFGARFSERDHFAR